MKKTFVKLFQSADIEFLEKKINQWIYDNPDREINYIETSVNVASGAPITTILIIGENY